MDRKRGRDQIIALAAAHGALTDAVVRASRLITDEGRGDFAEHLDHHRAELNVMIGELAMWVESFGQWKPVDVAHAIHPSALDDPPGASIRGEFGRELLLAREQIKARRADVLTELTNTRLVLGAAGLPVEELTTYRRLVRLWAGEALDVVTGVHRLTLADRYIRSFAQLCANSDRDAEVRRTGAALLRQWMDELEEADREGELVLAEVCGYGHFVESYRSGVTSEN
jgi:hypothetical protein